MYQRLHGILKYYPIFEVNCMNDNDSIVKSWLFAKPIRLAIKLFFWTFLFGTICTFVLSTDVIYRNPYRAIAQIILVSLLGAILVYLEAKRIKSNDKTPEQ
jgi:hypothetical protein